MLNSWICEKYMKKVHVILSYNREIDVSKCEKWKKLHKNGRKCRIINKLF